MYKRKYHVFLGILSLAISIVLPTLIHQYYHLLKPWNDAILQNSFYVAVLTYGSLFILVLLLLVFLVVAMHELGGSLIRIIKSDKQATIERFAGARH